jgi:hypothetical protein
VSKSGFSEGKYWDEAGRAWERVDDMVEPEEVLTMLAAGVAALVEWCASRPRQESSDVMNSEVLPKLAGREAYRKMMRKKKKSVKTVFVAEEWQSGPERRMLILVEGPPAPRAHTMLYPRS